MKEVGSCSPNSEALEDCALLIDVGYRWSKIDMLQAYKNGAGAATTVWE